VAERFAPEKIILFGSHAYGQPHADSDVDILVIMPARNEIDQAVRIDRVVDPPFPLDLIVCTPGNLAWRLKEGDTFLREVMAKGTVLYEKANRPTVTQDATAGQGPAAAVGRWCTTRQREPLTSAARRPLTPETSWPA
jgi:predicted nucleotidyltransferase